LLRSGNAPVLCEELAAWRALLPPDCVAQHTLASTEAQVIAQWMVPAGRLPGVSLAAGSLEPLHEMALLDEHGAAVASGEAGELVLRGPYLAVGEWRDGALVPGRLPPEPGRPGWRRFHTGDLARVEPDGLLRMLGRADRQVKINGVRVEPAEVEAVLRAEPGVADAAVLALGQPGQVVLLGAVAAPGLAPEAVSASLRQRLAASLPSAFRPARLLVLEELPRLPGAGKHDLQALRRLAEGG
jgi:acyl-CoA synthetase (AMP-forming)/AMP-acid ligase II